VIAEAAPLIAVAESSLAVNKPWDAPGQPLALGKYKAIQDEEFRRVVTGDRRAGSSRQPVVGKIS